MIFYFRTYKNSERRAQRQTKTYVFKFDHKFVITYNRLGGACAHWGSASADRAASYFIQNSERRAQCKMSLTVFYNTPGQQAPDARIRTNAPARRINIHAHTESRLQSRTKYVWHNSKYVRPILKYLRHIFYLLPEAVENIPKNGRKWTDIHALE